MSKIVYSSVLALVMASPAFAAGEYGQATQSDQQQAMQDQTTQDQAMQGQEQQPDQQQAMQQQDVQYQAAATKLMDQKVTDQQGQEVGTIKDLLLDDQNKVSHVVLSAGGMFGMGGRDVAVPIDQLQIQPDQVTFSGSEQEIQDMAEFQYQDQQQQAMDEQADEAAMEDDQATLETENDQTVLESEDDQAMLEEDDQASLDAGADIEAEDEAIKLDEEPSEEL